MDKKFIWWTPKLVLEIDNDYSSVILPGKAGKRLTVVIEDVRKKIPEESFSNSVQQDIKSIDEKIEEKAPETNEIVTENVEEGNEKCAAGEKEDADFSGISEVPAPGNGNETVNRGERIEVYWPIDKTSYPGLVQTLRRDRWMPIQYDDGEVERLNMENELWQRQSLTGSTAIAQNGKISCSKDISNKIVDAETAELVNLYAFLGKKKIY